MYSTQIVGLRAEPIMAEVDVFRGAHSFSIGGFPDKAVEESRDRVSFATKMIDCNQYTCYSQFSFGTWIFRAQTKFVQRKTAQSKSRKRGEKKSPVGADSSLLISRDGGQRRICKRQKTALIIHGRPWIIFLKISMVHVLLFFPRDLSRFCFWSDGADYPLSIGEKLRIRISWFHLSFCFETQCRRFK